MSFALPSAFWLAAFAAPIVIFYIMKVRLRRQPVSTNLFWKQIYDEKPPRSIWQYFRQLLSLLVQLLMLGLLVLAIADPYLPWELLQARRMVLVIDRSASMRTPDVAPTRFDAAIASAMNVMDGLRFRDELAIVAAGSQPEVAMGMSSHVPTLKRALRELTPADTPSDLAAAIELAKQLVGDHARGEVLVYTDGCALRAASATSATESESPPPNRLTDGKQVKVSETIFATRASNVGITLLQARRSLVDPMGYEALVAVSNAGDSDVECRLELELNGLPVDVLPLKLKPNEKWRRSLQKTSVDGGTLTAKLTRIAEAAVEVEKESDEPKERQAGVRPSVDSLSVDNTAWALLAARKPQRVLLVTEGNLFLRKVFEANPLVECETAKAPPKEWPADTIVVLHRQVPAVLPPGNSVVVEPAASCDAWEMGETIENPIITQQKAESPLMAHVRLDNMLMPSAKRIDFKSQPEVLAGTVTGEAVYAFLPRTSGKCLVLSVDLDQSDLAFRTAFPIMMTNALNWFRGNTGELESALASGSLTRIPIESSKQGSETRILLRSPTRRDLAIQSGQPSNEPAGPGEQSDVANTDTSATVQAVGADVSLGPFDECGVWKVLAVETDDQEKIMNEIAVNLANEDETDVRPRTESTATAPTIVMAGGWFVRPLWYYIAACACVLTLAEWVLHQRRILT